MVDMDQTAAAAGDYLSLYRRAFAEYGVRALWNKRSLEEPTAADAVPLSNAFAGQRSGTARPRPVGGLSNALGTATRPMAE